MGEADHLCSGNRISSDIGESVGCPATIESEWHHASLFLGRYQEDRLPSIDLVEQTVATMPVGMQMRMVAAVRKENLGNRGIVTSWHRLGSFEGLAEPVGRGLFREKQAGVWVFCSEVQIMDECHPLWLFERGVDHSHP